MSSKTPRINYRQKTLLGLLRTFDGHLPKVDFQKYLFLYTHEFQKDPSFEFVPYKYGSFSFQSYADKRRLNDIGALAESDDWCLNQDFKVDYLYNRVAFSQFYRKYSGFKGDSLIQDIYRRYPYYAINSEIAHRLMTKEEIEAIDSARPDKSQECFFTIGYEGSSFEGYLNRLIKNNVKTLVDVRRNALSRKYGFSKKTLSGALNNLGIEYIHIPELGIASEKRQNLNDDKDYEQLFDSYEKNELQKNEKALEQLFQIFLDRKRVAITCFEAHSSMCHRGRIAKALSHSPKWNFDIRHI
jgi:uncharacterized protein (DUF488 family)